MKKPIEELIVEKCIRLGATISTAESCTGGLVAGTLVNVPGVSAVFKEGYVTYSNGAKERLLQVSEKTLKDYGAVSAQTAEEMAAGCAKEAHSDYAVVTTGIAGPDGGSAEKPVGLVFIGCYAKGTVTSYKCQFDGDRQQVRHAAVQRALELLNEQIVL